MQDLWDELYGRLAPRHYGEDIAPEFTGDPLPDKHGWSYHLSAGCRCEKCERECQRRQDQTSQHVKQIPDDVLTFEQWKAARAA